MPISRFQGMHKLTFLCAFLSCQFTFCGLSAEPASKIDIRKQFDFSHCGYAGSDAPVPFVRAVYSVAPAKGDATELIQQAIDTVSSLPLNKDGFRGAVLLQNGHHKVYGRLIISASGVVLRGGDNTVLIAAGNKRRTLIGSILKMAHFTRRMPARIRRTGNIAKYVSLRGEEHRPRLSYYINRCGRIEMPILARL